MHDHVDPCLCGDASRYENFPALKTMQTGARPPVDNLFDAFDADDSSACCLYSCCCRRCQCRDPVCVIHACRLRVDMCTRHHRLSRAGVGCGKAGEREQARET